MPLTSTGFNARRFSEIRSEIFERMSNDLAIELNTSSEQVLSVITNIFASSVTDIEELAQAVSNNMNIDKAEGKYLDDLVALINLKRLDQSYTTGILSIKSTRISSTINAGLQVSDSNGNVYRTTIPTLVSNLSCTECYFEPYANNGLFSVTIDGETYSINYQSPTTPEGISEGLAQEINSLENVFRFQTVLEGSGIRIIKDDKSVPFSITVNSNLTIKEVEVPTQIRADLVGPIAPEEQTITNVISNTGDVVSVTNYFPMSVGRNVETDEELRARQAKSTQISGGGTAPAIYSRIANIVGVSQVRIFQNTGQNMDSNGLPPKSYEVIVEGGDDNTIAQAIYDSKPAGARLYGEITTLVRDYAGNNESVLWSRPQPIYINVRVTYSLYNEEIFPDDGADAIKRSIVEAGNSLDLDQDVIPQRLMGAVYNGVNGVGTMKIEVGTSVNPESPVPDNIPYSTNPISINARSKPDFSVNRIVLVEE